MVSAGAYLLAEPGPPCGREGSPLSDLLGHRSESPSLQSYYRQGTAISVLQFGGQIRVYRLDFGGLGRFCGHRARRQVVFYVFDPLFLVQKSIFYSGLGDRDGSDLSGSQ